MAEGVEEYRSCIVDQLKIFLRERPIPLTGNKEGLIKKVVDIISTDRLEEKIEALPFQSVKYRSPPRFAELPNDKWVNDVFLLITQTCVSAYLKERGGYNNF